MILRTLGLLVALALGAVAAPPVSRAQPAANIPRVGFLSAASLSSITARTDALRRGLRDLGYVEGQNVVIDWRAADDQWDRLPGLAAELVALKVSVIVTAEGPAAQAAHRTTRTIPIVMAQAGDPVAMGLVASLAHPGGNITGLTPVSAELPGKQVQLIKEIVPRLSRLAVLSNPLNPLSPFALKQVADTARALKLQILPEEATESKDLEAAFASMRAKRADALIVLPDPMFLGQRSRIAELAVAGRLPAIYGIPEHAEAGGLVAYAASRPELFRRAATYVVKILKGANPGDLPVEQATEFDLVINMKAANALRLTIPPSFLLRADQVIR